MSGPFSSAVISEAVSRVTSFLTGKYNEHKNVQEMIDRLEMACIEIKSALLESEEFDINNDEPLHQWQEKLKEALCEAEEALNNIPAEILHKKPNQRVEGGSSSRDQSMQQEGYDDATLGLPASNLWEAVPRQVDLEPNIPHVQSMPEEGSDDPTLVLPASNLREAIPHQVDLEPNLTHVQSMPEEGSDDPTLLLPASNLREAVPRQVDLEPNVSHVQLMPEEGSDDATLVHPASNLSEAVTRQVHQETSLPHVTRLRRMTIYVWRVVFNVALIRIVLYFDDLARTVEKLEKMAGNIGNFIKLLELQKKRKMSRKRKRSGVALQGFFVVLSLKLQTYALFCYREDPYLLVIMLFCANCNIPTGITSDIFIGFIK